MLCALRAEPLVFLAVAAMAAANCQCGSDGNGERPRPVKATTVALTWAQFDGRKQSDPQEAIYLLDGKTIGKGDKGFESVLRELESFPPGSKVMVYPDNDVWGFFGLGGYGWESSQEPTSVPFRHSGILVERFKQTATRKGIEIWYLAGPPGSYVMKNGEEIKIRGN